MPAIDTSKLSAEIQAKYTVVNNSFRQIVKSDWRDQLVVEVGDVKQLDTFYPQVKICRWGDDENSNEVNLSARLKDDQVAAEAVTTDKEKIIWSKGTKEAHFYEIAPSAEHPEGGYEFEIILKSKPTTNKIEFSLQTKGLEFFYQPALTQEEINQGNVRPENVVGSYAVYYKDCPANYEGGKLYRVGKAFHIFRPRIEDSEGSWAWSELNIDVATGTLMVTIPQDFLDKAVYPVRHAAGLEFGFTGVGGSTDYWGSNYATVCKFTSPSDIATATSISVYHASTTDVGFKGCIWLFSDRSLVANAVGTANDITSDTFDFYTSSFSTPPTLSASTAYWIGYVGSTNFHHRYDAGDSGQYGYVLNNYGTPNNLGTPTTASRKMSVYATYTAAGGTTTQTSTAKARIKSPGVTKTIQARSRVKQTAVTKTIQSKGRLKQTSVTTTLQAKSRVKQQAVTRTSTSKARVKQTGVTNSLTAKANVVLYGEWSDVWTVNVILGTQTQSTTARARLKRLGVSQTAQAKARIRQAAVTKTLQTKGRIKQESVTKTSTARARIQQAAITKTVQAKARLLQTASKTTQARARVRQLGVSRTLQARGMVLSGTSKILQAKAAVKQTTSHTIQSRVRVKQSAVTKTLTAKARLKQTAISRTLQARGRVKQSAIIASVQGRANIKQAAISQTSQAKARIKQLSSATVTAKAKILSLRTLQTITARCSLKQVTEFFLQARAYIVRFAEGKIISAARTIEGIVSTRQRVGIIRADRLNR